MMGLPFGVLLPESILDQGWFHTFALFVAFNTIVYFGLTLSKLVPWPAQIHPEQVRTVLPSVTSKDTTMKDIPRSDRNDPSGDFVRRRQLAAAQSIPLGLSLLVGVVIVIMTLILVFVSSSIDGLQVAVFCVAVAMLIWAQIASHTKISPRIIIWSWTVLVLVLIVLVSMYGILNDNEVAMTYAVILFVVLPGAAVSWPASLTGGVIGLAVLTIAGVGINQLNSLQWSIAALAAFGAGLVALEVRRNSIDRILLEEMKCQLLATTDPLTRSMSRAALGVLAPGVFEAAQASGQPVHAIMVDIVGMRKINVDYGTAYGDAVLISVCQAIQVAAPHPDLVGRWDGDCFLVLGIGPGPAVEEFARQVDGIVADRGVALGKRPIRVQCGIGIVPAQDASLETVVHRAWDSLGEHPVREPADRSEG